MALPESISAGIAALADDNMSGATEITKHAAAVVLELSDPRAETSESELQQQLKQVADAFIRAQPAMAPMLNLAEKIFRSLRDQSDITAFRERFRSLISTYASQLDTSTSRIALHARELLKEQSRILTHSHSSVVKKTLVSLHQGGWRGSVVCTESRPMNEGVELARDLARQGIPVTLLTDAAVFSSLPGVSALVLGADSVSSRGVVNKVGSSGFVLASSTHSIPVYVLCGSEKFIPEELVLIEKRKSSELLAGEVVNLDVHNVYFDVTPLEQITGFVTQEGFLSPSQVRDQLATVAKDFVLKASDVPH